MAKYDEFKALPLIILAKIARHNPAMVEIQRPSARHKPHKTGARSTGTWPWGAPMRSTPETVVGRVPFVSIRVTTQADLELLSCLGVLAMVPSVEPQEAPQWFSHGGDCPR